MQNITCIDRDTMLQALRFCVIGAGKKMADVTRKGIMGTLLSIMGCQEDSTRSVASGCVGAMCGVLPSEELADVMIQHLLGTHMAMSNVLARKINCKTLIFRVTLFL